MAASSVRAATNRPTFSASRSSSATTSRGPGVSTPSRVASTSSGSSTGIRSSFFSGDDYGRVFLHGRYTGNAFADFLVGLPSTTRYAQNPPDARPYSTQFAGYIQDDWRVSSKLTVNYGVRYDLRPPYLDRGNQLANFDRDFPGGRIIVANEAAKALIPQSVKNAVPNTPIVTAAEVGLSERLRKTDKNNINPRVGFAYRPTLDGKWVFRGGYGLYTVPLYGSISYSMYASATGDVPSFQNAALPTAGTPSSSRTCSPGAARDSRRRHAGFPAGQPDRSARSANAAMDSDRRAGSRLEHRPPRQLCRVVHEGSGLQPGPEPDPTRIPPAMRRSAASVRSSDWNVVTTRDNGSRARYNGADLEVSKRVGQGVSFSSSYTLAQAQLGLGRRRAHRVHCRERSLDPRYVSRRCRLRSRGLHATSPFGQHVLLPLPVHKSSRGMEALIAGWDVTGILLLQSGSFETALFSNRDPRVLGPTSGDSRRINGQIRWVTATCRARRRISTGMSTRSCCQPTTSAGSATERWARSSDPARKSSR